MSAAAKKVADLRVAGAARAWLVVKALSGREAFLQAHLDRAGFEYYRPMIQKERYDRFQKRTVIEPRGFLGAYLFVRPPRDAVYRVFSMPYVQQVLKVAVFDNVIKEVRELERQKYELNWVPPQGVKPGEAILLKGYLKAMVDETIDTNRIGVITGLFKGGARTYCSLEDVIRQ